MSNDASIMRLRAGVTAISTFVLTVLGAVVLRSRGIGAAIDYGSADTILEILAAHPTVIAILVWVVVVHSVLIAIFGIDLYRILADGRSGLLFAPVALIGGAGLFIIEVLMLLGISQGLAPLYAGATGAEGPAIEGTARALLRFRNRMLLVAGVLWSFAAVIFGREMLRSTEFPGWLGYWGFAAGVIGVIGGLFPLFAPLVVVRSLGLFLFLLWV